ncbi:MAG TPA: serine hydrolase domain-containing protein, partial [Longimicrobium sp.]
MRLHHPSTFVLAAAAILAACAGPRAVAVSPSPAATRPVDARLALRALTKLVAAINGGDTAQVARFAERTYDARYLGQSGGVPRAVQRWMEIHTLYGPLAVDTLIAADSAQAHAWLRGTISRAWLDVRVFVDSAPPHQITRVGLGRGIRPPFADARTVPVTPAELPARLRRALGEMAGAGLFSGSIAVWSGGRRLFEGSYGMENREAGVPNTPRTRFDLASVGKMFTAVAALQLAESGRLDLDAPVGRYVPSLPPQIGGRVTARQLLEHSSGLGEIG